MELVPLLAAGAGAGAGAGVAAAGAGATAAAGAGAGTGLSLFSTALTGAAGLAGSMQQAAVLRRSAAIDEENAQRVKLAGLESAKDKDQEAALILGNQMSQAGSSGISVGSLSTRRLAARNRFLAQRDRTRIVDDASQEAKGLFESAAAKRSGAKAAGLSGLFSLASTGVNMYDDLLSSATFTNKLTASRLTRQARRIR